MKGRIIDLKYKLPSSTLNLTFLSPIQSDSQVCAQFTDQKKGKGMIKRKWLIIPLWCLEVYPLGKKQGESHGMRKAFFPRLTKESLSVGGWNLRRRLWKQRSVFMERGADPCVPREISEQPERKCCTLNLRSWAIGTSEASTFMPLRMLIKTCIQWEEKPREGPFVWQGLCMRSKWLVASKGDVENAITHK